MTRLLALLAAVVAFAGLLAATAIATPNPVACTGYPEARIFVESQTWWLTTPGKAGTDFGHVHVGGCLPSEQRVSGTVGLDLRVIMHGSEGGTFDRIEPVAKTDTQETTLGVYTGCRGTTTETGTVTCWQHVDIDTTDYTLDGRQELRLRSWSRTPDGSLMHVSLNLLWDVRNGNTLNPLGRLPYDRAKGWYSAAGVGYCEARIVTPIVPGLRSGTIRYDVEFPNHDESLPITAHSARLDPDFHAEPPIPGTVLLSGAGPLGVTTITIDTTRLSDGPHKLVLRSDCDTPTGSTNSGVGVVVFTVANGTAGPSGPSPSTVPTATPDPTSTATAPPTATPAHPPQPAPSATPTATPTVAPTPTPTATPSPDPTASPMPTATPDPSPSCNPPKSKRCR